MSLTEIIIGKIGYSVSKPAILEGESGTVVRDGFFLIDPSLPRKRAAVICLENSSCQLTKEFRLFIELTSTHENVHCYWTSERGPDKTFIAAEPVDFTLHDYYFRKPEVSLHLNQPEVLKQLAEAVHFLHGYQFIHRAIKPQHCFVTSGSTGRPIIKLSGFGIAKKTLDGSASNSGTRPDGGWSPEEMLNPPEAGRLTSAVDIFSLGCVFYYVLTNGDHPFGRTPLIRNMNILDDNYSLKKIDKNSAIYYLIQRMISRDPSQRPSINEVLKNPYFLGDFHLLYDVPATIPGLCVIINQRDFLNLSDAVREGTDIDRDNLEKTFQLFGFQVKIHENLTGAEIRKTVRELCAGNLKKYRSLVICVLSHGKEGHIYGSDMIPVSLENLKRNFSGIFANRPKIFVVQACQGNEHQETAAVADISVASSKSDAVLMEENECSVEDDTKNVPAMSEFLELYATLHGYYAYRNADEGSVFIQKLCQKLQEDGHRKDLLSLLVEVNAEVSQWIGECTDDSSRRTLLVKQMSEVRHSLTKNIQLKRC